MIQISWTSKWAQGKKKKQKKAKKKAISWVCNLCLSA
jgi:hypothetical protein